MRVFDTLRALSLIVLVGIVLVGPVAATAPPAKQLGKQITEFTLRDFHGKERSLDEFAGKPVAVVFVGSDCPLAKLYAPRLESIFQQFKEQGVGVVAINSNIQDSLEKVSAYARIHKVTFPVF